MSQTENPKRESRFSGLTSALRRRPEEKVVIADYRVGDIRSEDPIVVTQKAIILGDLLAPEVVVSGLVYGYIACRHLIVAPGGQVWGDVYVSALEMAPDGKVNGWVCTLDAGTVDLVRAGELGRGDLSDRVEGQLPSELIERIQNSGADIEADQAASQRRSGIWRQLRSEAALAIIARSEIELTLEARLEEGLAENAAKVAALEQQIEEDQGPRDDEVGLTVSAADAGAEQDSDEVELLRAQLRQATSAAQKYYGEMLWTRAELRAAKNEADEE